MKKMKKYFLYFLALFAILSACKQMDSTYKEFVIPNGLNYPQKADSLKIYPGYYRLLLQWEKPKAPNVKYSMVYWNNYTDSLKVNFPSDSDTVSLLIKDLSESSYSFNIKNFDAQGNVSIPVEATSTPYGANYLIGATDRSYTIATRDEANTGTITWGTKTSDLMYTEVKYMTTSDTYRTIKALPTESITICDDIKAGERFQYRSFFLPKNGLDTIAREWQTSEKPFMYNYPRNDWFVSARNGNHAWGDGGGGQPALLLDGKTNTGWHSNASAPLPQCVVVDLKESLIIDHIILTPPSTVGWRYIRDVDIYFSDTPITPDVPQESWGPPVVRSTYLSGDTFKVQLPEPKSGQYVALVFPNSKSNTYISFMELNIFGY